jgi:hypothetical protein
MTDPSTHPDDDVSSGADAGSMNPDSMGEPSPDLGADLGYAGANQSEEQDDSGTPGEATDSPAAQGAPAGPPD